MIPKIDDHNFDDDWSSVVRTGVLGIESSMENLIERIERLENCCKKCGMYKVVQVEERLTGAK